MARPLVGRLPGAITGRALPAQRTVGQVDAWDLTPRALIVEGRVRQIARVGDLSNGRQLLLPVCQGGRRLPCLQRYYRQGAPRQAAGKAGGERSDGEDEAEVRARTGDAVDD